MSGFSDDMRDRLYPGSYKPVSARTLLDNRMPRTPPLARQIPNLSQHSVRPVLAPFQLLHQVLFVFLEFGVYVSKCSRTSGGSGKVKP